MVLKPIADAVTSVIALVPTVVAKAVELVELAGKAVVDFLKAVRVQVEKLAVYLDDAFSE